MKTKRLHDNENQTSEKGDKVPRLDHVPLQSIGNFGDGMLGLLPNDVLEHLLVKYLSPADKKNLKLASKTCENRVMTLDRKHMRKWKIVINDKREDYQDTILPLMKAKMRHAASGNLEKIQLSLVFDPNSMSYGEEYLERMLMYADILINHWKDNISKLEMCVCGSEFFMLDPTIKLSNLKSLSLNKYSNVFTTAYTEHELIDFGLESVCSFFIEKHADTLENLKLVGIEVQISRKLCIKTFESHEIDVLSVLKHCNTTLEKLIWMRSDTRTEMENPEFKDLQFQLKELETNLEKNTVQVIKTCKTTLEKLKLFHWRNNDLVKELESVGLELKQFEAYGCTKPLIISFLKASNSTIEDLKIHTVDDYFEIYSCRDIVFRKLRKLSVTFTCTWLVHFLIRSAKDTLTELDLGIIQSLGLNTPKLPKLKILKCMGMPAESLSSLLEENKDSLEELDLSEIGDIDYFNLNVPQLFLKKLRLYSQNSARAASILIELSSSTLKEVELHHIRVDNDEDGIMSPEITLSLTRLVANMIKPEIVFQVLRSSLLTLRDLELEYIDPPTDEHISHTDMNLNLTRLVGTEVAEIVVDTILNLQEKPINVLLLRYRI